MSAVCHISRYVEQDKRCEDCISAFMQVIAAVWYGLVAGIKPHVENGNWGSLACEHAEETKINAIFYVLDPST